MTRAGLSDEERESRFYAVTPGGDLETLRGDVHHLLNPLIGHLRMIADGFDPAEIPLDPRVSVELPDGVPHSVAIDQAELVVLVQRLMVVRDLCDAAIVAARTADLAAQVARVAGLACSLVNSPHAMARSIGMEIDAALSPAQPDTGGAS